MSAQEDIPVDIEQDDQHSSSLNQQDAGLEATAQQLSENKEFRGDLTSGDSKFTKTIDTLTNLSHEDMSVSRIRCMLRFARHHARYRLQNPTARYKVRFIMGCLEQIHTLLGQLEQRDENVQQPAPPPNFLGYAGAIVSEPGPATVEKRCSDPPFCWFTSGLGWRWFTAG